MTGELWALLRRLNCSPNAIQSWTGPSGEAHDFRFDAAEVEVKTTSGQRRRHRVSRLDQLQPSPSKVLWVLSIQVARAGSGEGWTLGEQIREVRERIGDRPETQHRFTELLSAARWADEDISIYPDRWQLRSAPVVAEVDGEFPRITQDLIGDALGTVGARIDDVSYRLDLEGLGHPDESPEFLALFPLS